jgi:hypothetical protein
MADFNANQAMINSANAEHLSHSGNTLGGAAQAIAAIFGFKGGDAPGVGAHDVKFGIANEGNHIHGIGSILEGKQRTGMIARFFQTAQKMHEEFAKQRGRWQQQWPASGAWRRPRRLLSKWQRRYVGCNVTSGCKPLSQHLTIN